MKFTQAFFIAAIQASVRDKSIFGARENDSCSSSEDVEQQLRYFLVRMKILKLARITRDGTALKIIEHESIPPCC
jgi:hypothetical protein